MEIVFSDPLYQHLERMFAGNEERGAALLLQRDPISDRFLVQEVVIAEEEDRLHATATEITFAPQFLVRVTRLAQSSGRSLALIHSHPSGFLEFSGTDDRTEAGLVDFLRDRNPTGFSFSLVLCDGRILARRVGEDERLPVRIVGPRVTVMRERAETPDGEQYDRQIRAFGSAGQKIVSSLTVALVGLGGTGSVAAQQLAHLGVRNFVLIDPDVLEETNLTRVVGTVPYSVGHAKIDSAAALITSIQPEASVRCVQRSVMAKEAIDALRAVDCVFMCTDSHVSRALLSEFSYQYLVPAFDVGVSINAHEGKVEAVTGRTQMVCPGLPCLWCSQVLSPHRIREELMTEQQRAADPYFNEGGERQPAVISINSTMVSMAVTMFLGAFTAIPVEARWQSYDALSGKVRPLSAKPDPACGVCGKDGVLGYGPSKDLSLADLEGR
jgi:hypothetical protein